MSLTKENSFKVRISMMRIYVASSWRKDNCNLEQYKKDYQHSLKSLSHFRLATKSGIFTDALLLHKLGGLEPVEESFRILGL